MRPDRATLPVFVLPFLFPGTAFALDLWVDSESRGGPCDDGRARIDVTEKTPLCALGVAATMVQPGDTVHVQPGTYSEPQECLVCTGDTVLEVVTSGLAEDPIRFVAESSGVVRLTGAEGTTVNGIRIAETTDGIQPQFVEINGFQVAGFEEQCVRVSDTSDVVLRDLEVSGCQRGAVDLIRTARVVVEGSRIHDNVLGPTSAVTFRECGTGNVARANRVWNNSDDHDLADVNGHGLAIADCRDGDGDVRFESNLVWENEGNCIALDGDAADVRNNTCWLNGLRDAVGEIRVAGNGHALHNNVAVVRDLRFALSFEEPEGVLIEPGTITEGANLLWSRTRDDVVGWFGDIGTVDQYVAGNPGAWGEDTIQRDPLLVDPAGHDFEPTEGSPVVDTGDPNFAADTDVRGALRPADGDEDGSAIVDRGAFELGAVGGDADTDADSDADAGSDADADGDGDGAGGDVGADSGELPPGGRDGESCGCRATDRSPSAAFAGLALAFARVGRPRKRG